MRKYTITGESVGKCTKSTTLSGDTVITDLPIEKDGTGSSGSPVEVLLAAVIGCEYLTALYIASELGFKLEKVTHTLTAERDENGVFHKPLDEDAPNTAAVQKIYGTVDVVTDATQQQIDKLEAILKKRCPIARLVGDSGCELDVKWRKVN